MAEHFVYRGAVSPESILLNIVPGDSGLDLSTVTGASITAYHSDRTSETWSVTLSNQSESTLRLTHAFASGDTDVAENLVLVASLTTPSGNIRCTPLTLRIKEFV